MAANGITGALGSRWRADVTPWGAVVPWDGSPPLEWHVAADDRWHSPATEIAVRQHRVGGTPVFETRLRVPSGDAVQRCYSVAAGHGATVIELINDSALPIAVALTRPDLLTNRPPSAVGVQGIDLPEGTIVVPIGHRTSATVAIDHGAGGPGPLPTGVPPADAVVRGWRSLADRASRLDLPDPELVEAVVAARCDLLLAGPPAPDVDAVGFLLGVTELVRLGELPASEVRSLAEDVAAAVEAIAGTPGWEVDAALAGAAVVLAGAGDRRAVRDVEAITGRRPTSPVPATTPAGVRSIAWVERHLADGPSLLPDGLPTAWRGADVEAHGLVIGPSTRLSVALRWHGERPALLWEQDGPPLRLRAPVVAPGWTNSESHGETLWPPVDAVARIGGP